MGIVPHLLVWAAIVAAMVPAMKPPVARQRSQQGATALTRLSRHHVRHPFTARAAASGSAGSNVTSRTSPRSAFRAVRSTSRSRRVRTPNRRITEIGGHQAHGLARRRTWRSRRRFPESATIRPVPITLPRPCRGRRSGTWPTRRSVTSSRIFGISRRSGTTRRRAPGRRTSGPARPFRKSQAVTRHRPPDSQ